MKTINYKFAEEYTPYPGGRFIRLGDFSGEDFREKVLIPVFENNNKIIIDATGVKTSFSPSFLDEAFGEVAKKSRGRLMMATPNDPTSLEAVGRIASLVNLLITVPITSLGFFFSRRDIKKNRD